VVWAHNGHIGNAAATAAAAAMGWELDFGQFAKESVENQWLGPAKPEQAKPLR
jgi:erythromycin esterase-like protein